MISNEEILGARILAIDDEETNLLVISALLDVSGFTCIVTERDSRNAIALIQDFNPELLILDLNMPFKSGYELLEELRELGKGEWLFPVVVLTADTTTHAKHRALLLGADDFLTKPVDRVELELRVRNHVYAHKMRLRARSHAESLEAKVAARTADLTAANRRLVEFDRLKSEFLATASHELRTPLTVIREYSSLLRDGAAGTTPSEIADAYETINRNCDRLGKLLDDLLDFHRIESGSLRLRRSETDLEALLTQCVHDFSVKCNAEEIDLTVQLLPRLNRVLADPHLISQVMSNLIGNAIKFTPRGGSITVSAENRGALVEISVQDSGPGICPEDVARAFEPFGQLGRSDAAGAGAKGTGLGLPISRRIVEMHDGTLMLASEPGEGSRFYFTLPMWDEGRLVDSFLKDSSAAVGVYQDLCFLILRPEVEDMEAGILALHELRSVCSKVARSSDSFIVVEPNRCVVCLLALSVEGVSKFIRRVRQAAGSGMVGTIRLRHSIQSIDRQDEIADVYLRALALLDEGDFIL